MQNSSRSTRPTWDEYFVNAVDALALRATCDRGRSAAIFVRDNDILASGYVGAPPGLPHCDDVGHLWSEDGKHCLRTLHAEQNAVIRAARTGVSLRDSTVYCTMEPCLNCAMTMISLGVYRIVAKHAYHAAQHSRNMLDEASVALVTISRDELYDPTPGRS